MTICRRYHFCPTRFFLSDPVFPNAEPSLLQNDSVDNFLSELQETTRRWPVVAEALDAVLKAEYIDKDLAGAALGAGALVAAARGHAHVHLDEVLAFWASRRPPKNLDQLSELAVRGVERVRSGSEMAETWEDHSPIELWNRQIDELVGSLRLPAGPASAVAKPKRLRVRAGDVVQLALNDGRYAYARVGPKKLDSPFHIYAKLSSEPGRPPIGCRDYLFAIRSLYNDVVNGTCPIVGSDPWKEGYSEPKFCEFSYPRMELVGKPGNRLATPAECFGADRYSTYSFKEMVERIVDPINSKAARMAWPLLPGPDGVVRSIRWSDWNPEWEAVWNAKNPRVAAIAEQERLENEIKKGLRPPSTTEIVQ